MLLIDTITKRAGLGLRARFTVNPADPGGFPEVHLLKCWSILFSDPDGKDEHGVVVLVEAASQFKDRVVVKPAGDEVQVKRHAGSRWRPCASALNQKHFDL